ncbi:MAG TPA: hypothetical protein VL400_14170 [Polyangiaceae bacterium]|nr:hypothetical protein [Polyangiaceae bacterium]
METPRDLFQIDRTLRKVLTGLASGTLDAARLPRELSSKATFDDLGELRGDPLADAVRSWVGHLTVLRVTASDVARAREARVADDHVSPVSDAPLSFRALAREVARARPDAERWIAALAGASSRARDAIVVHAERRAEATRRLGVQDPGDVDHPPFRRADVDQAARAVLDATDAAFAAEVGRGELRRAVEISLARDAGEGWPAHLTERWVRSLFRGPLTDGLAIELGELPAELGAASFARALASFGAGLARADVGRGAPVALCRTPGDVLVSSRAALFGGLALEPAFHRRKLGTDASRARGESRRVARAALLWLRVAAARALVWRTLGEATAWSERLSTASDVVERATGAPIDRALVGVFPRVSPDDGAVVVGALLALSARESLRDAFDEDWFDNPRAAEALRHEHQATTLARGYGPRSVEAGIAALARWVGHTYA